MQDFLNKKILLGVCGGIAAYKSALLVRELTQLGAQVKVVMTASAQEFITPLTMQALSGHEVRVDLFDRQAERAMGHIELARWADYLVIAPASAHCLAKMAQGLADDLLSTLYLVAEVPVFVCPAMNRSMWAHAATQSNCDVLKQRGVIFIGPERGEQACGEVGLGRVSEPLQIINALRQHEAYQLLQGKQVVITAGPTREAIDPVRFLSNYSSGKMGYALASAAVMAGAKVTLISGPCHLDAPDAITRIDVQSAQEMYDAVMQHLQKGCIFISAAAVADYTIEVPALEKMKKKNQTELSLTFTKTQDIVAAVAESQLPAWVVGFAAETTHVLEYARDKLKQKKMDMIVANQVGPGLGFDAEENQVVVITKDRQIALSLTHKMRLAGQLIAILASSLQNAS
ncbi:MAG: bifunctional phosphopantothenoylcysteine decarboxylase/phosphopantothenate--cysteine ligase CoaBC [Legionella sp.]|nr:MAG: bifunctional phosphopantothenoylcysteine decarboxylase/phosphopantothenate--cysteine ligase CoaBC [Legionella sp.]PJD98395.1 MAG: bifunctional phosphopantothenoylcysteine decarboxylase/phosphopantothenate--cysteine ligase CoaBC [Legionella sp.]